MAFRTLLCIVALALSLSVSRADLINEVPQQAQDELAAGQMVVRTQDVSGAPWPRVVLYQVVNAPISVMWNLLNDLNSAPTYTPNLISAVVQSTNGNTKDVLYTVKVPILQKISYTVQNTYVTGKRGYTISWTLLQSPLAKSSEGSIRIDPYGNNQTLMCYTNLTVPITNLVAGLKGQALSEAKTTVRAIQAEAQRRAGN